MTDSIQKSILKTLPSFENNRQFFDDIDIEYFLKKLIPSFLESWKNVIKNNTVSIYEGKLMNRTSFQDPKFIFYNEHICSLFGVPNRNIYAAIDLIMELNSKVNKVYRWNTLSEESKKLLIKGYSEYTRFEIYQSL